MRETNLSVSGEASLRFLYAAVVFAGATLLFGVQPMTSRAVLPLLGGSPAVWNTAMMFFQTALLLGYLYAHLLCRVRWPGAQVAIHAVVLTVGALLTPVLMPQWAASVRTLQSPVLQTLVLTGALAGAPFVALAAVSPLLQRWFSLAGRPGSRDPYFLYAASNAGSLLALLAYPLVVEPWLTLGQQRVAWRTGYVLFAVMAIAAGVCTFVRGRGHPEPDAPGEAAAPAVPAWTQRGSWVLLAAVPSSLMLGTTQHLSMNVAAVPLLWVVPLAIYLLTYIVAFTRSAAVATRLAGHALPLLAVAAAVMMMPDLYLRAAVKISVHLLLLLAGAMVCHGRLAAQRPQASYLTEYYLLLSVGGALGGVFNALVAPRIFPMVIEYPLAVAAACLFAHGAASVGGKTLSGLHRLWRAGRWLVAPGAVWLAVVLVTQAHPALGKLSPRLPALLLWLVPAVICLSAARNPRLFSAALAAFLAVPHLGLSMPSAHATVYAARTFFGTYRITTQPDGAGHWHQFWHGNTTHGMQYTLKPWADQPTTYFHQTGPIGDVLRVMNSRADFDRAAIIGMGAGTLAAYGRQGQTFTFYEIDPEVARVAASPEYFTYVSGSQASVEPVIGDARLTIADAPDSLYDLLVIDAFIADAIPIHLITREAVALYLRKLAPGGVLAFHITNWYLELEPVLAAVCPEFGLSGAVCRNGVNSAEEGRSLAKYASVWVALSRDSQAIAALSPELAWQPIQAKPGFRTWTDDYSNIFSVFRW